jgi:hypothetical protein
MPNFKRNVLEGLPFTPIPDYFLAYVMADLSPTELKVMLYIYLHTAGYGKKADSISYDQFLNGITAQDGRQIDKGAGVSRRALITALAGLETRGLIMRVQTGFNMSVIRLQFPQNPAIENTDTSNFIDITKSLPDQEEIKGKGELNIVAGKKVQNLQPQEPLQVQTFPVEVQNLHPTVESSHEKHENHDHGELSSSELPIKEQTQPLVEFHQKQVEGILTYMASQVPGLTLSNARRLVRIARSNGRDDTYIRQLVAHVTGNTRIHTPAAVLTVLIKSNEDRIEQKRQQKPLPINFDKYRRFQVAEAPDVSTDCHDERVTSVAIDVQLATLEIVSEQESNSVADIDGKNIFPTVSRPADSRLKFALQQHEPNLANYLRDMKIETSTAGDELVLRFIGKPTVDNFDWWLPDVQIYHPNVTSIRFC